MKKKEKFFIFCMIFVVKISVAQQISPEPNTIKGFNVALFPQTVPAKGQAVEKNYIPANFSVKNLGFFCKQELKFQSLTRLPLFFRLGSLDYCNRMEGKKNAGIIPNY